MHSLLAKNANPKLTHLIDEQSGQEVVVRDALARHRDDILELLARLQRSRKSNAPQDRKLLCALCYCPVYLCGRKEKTSFYFKHFVEDASCPAMAGKNLSEDEINALRYHGQRESAQHLRLKNIIADSVRADSAFSDPIVEGSWRGKDNKELRRPDVRTRFDGRLDIAFEVQLSTTFARIMAEREVFYRNEGAILFWIFGSFSLCDIKLLMEVIFVHNNRNAFMVNEATMTASIEAGAFLLDVVWTEPCIQSGALVWQERRERVRFADLTIDTEKQCAYYRDVASARRRVEHQLDVEQVAEVIQQFWLTYFEDDHRTRPAHALLEAQWREITRSARERGVSLPHFHTTGVLDVSRILLSAKQDRSIGWGYSTLWDAAHHVFAAYSEWLWIFVPALSTYGRMAPLEARDHHGKWRTKIDRLNDPVAWPTPAADRSLDTYIATVFPELVVHLEMAKAESTI